MNSAVDKILDTILQALNLFRFWVVLTEFESGIILRLGKLHKKVGPGFHWKWCLNIDELLYLNVRQQTSDSWEMTLSTLDEKSITVSFDLIVEVFDATKALLSVDKWKSVAYTTAKIVTSQIVETNEISVVMGPKFTELVKGSIDLALTSYGIRVVQFGMTDKARVRAYRLFMGAK